jgi:hypothetical protein
MVGAIALALAGLFLSLIGSASQVNENEGPPVYNCGPVTDYDAAMPTQGDVLRFRRGERYNSADKSGSVLDEDSEPELWDLPPTHFRKDPMPFDSSDAVIIGMISARAGAPFQR